MEKIGNIIGTNGKKILTKKPQESTPILERPARLRLPPIIKPRKLPAEIIAEILDFAEKDALKRHLKAHQKAGEGRNWDNYRVKIDADLLEKFQKVLSVCRENGFINPVVRGNKIYWEQLLSRVPATDKCVLCEKIWDCDGIFMLTKRGKEFRPCWDKRVTPTREGVTDKEHRAYAEGGIQ